jgi:putative FmdB family regulatory protein
VPIYEYVCADCEHRFETLVRRWGDAVACPSCASATVDRQLSVFAVASAGRSEPAGCEPGACSLPVCAGGTCGVPS